MCLVIGFWGSHRLIGSIWNYDHFLFLFFFLWTLINYRVNPFPSGCSLRSTQVQGSPWEVSLIAGFAQVPALLSSAASFTHTSPSSHLFSPWGWCSHWWTSRPMFGWRLKMTQLTGSMLKRGPWGCGWDPLHKEASCTSNCCSEHAPQCSSWVQQISERMRFRVFSPLGCATLDQRHPLRTCLGHAMAWGEVRLASPRSDAHPG